MVEEFKKFSMEVVGISETKWFGQDMYDVGAGCPVPGAGERVERNEGVGIVLSPSMVRCWKDGGSVWNQSVLVLCLLG